MLTHQAFPIITFPSAVEEAGLKVTLTLNNRHAMVIWFWLHVVISVLHRHSSFFPWLCFPWADTNVSGEMFRCSHLRRGQFCRMKACYIRPPHPASSLSTPPQAACRERKGSEQTQCLAFAFWGQCGSWSKSGMTLGVIRGEKIPLNC